MRNDAVLIGERRRGEMRLLLGMGADAGGGIMCLAETGVLARGGRGTFCVLMLILLEYVESTLLADLIIAE